MTARNNDDSNNDGNSNKFFMCVACQGSHNPHDAPDECTSLYSDINGDEIVSDSDDYNQNVDSLLQCNKYNYIMI